MAIAFDAVSSGQASATSVTFSHTNAGNFMTMGAGFNASVTNGAATFNGVSATRFVGSGTTAFQAFYLMSPFIGTANVVVSRGESQNIAAIASSYSGVLQTGFPDNSDTSGFTGTSATSISKNLTTVADNCWTLMFAQNDNATFVQSVGTLRVNRSGGQGQLCLVDSNAAKTPAGSVNLAATMASSNMQGGVIFSIEPIGIKTVNETSTADVSDALQKGVSRTIVGGTLALTDSVVLIKLLTINATDTVDVSDAFSRAVGRIISDAVSVGDTVSTNVRGLWNNRTKPVSNWTPRSKP